MRTLRYGADASWPFKGFDLPLTESVQSAVLTITGYWALDDETQPAEPPSPLLQKTITIAPTTDGEILDTQDGDGNWSLVFNLSAVETETSLAPDSAGVGRFLWYEVTLLTTPGTLVLRPYVGQIRMLPDLYVPAP